MSRNCSLVLHAHVPWVWHPEHEQSLEEDWLHSSILEAYLPLLEMMYRLREDEVPFQLTLNLSPTLLAMLGDAEMQKRTLQYMDRSLQLCQDEVDRGDQTGFKEQALAYLERFNRLRTMYEGRWKCDLIQAFADLRDSGHLEITASCATHGLLPLLLRVPEAVQAQIRAGIRQYVQSFERMPQGFWLPECAYAPALAQILKKEGVEWTIVEEHGLTHSPQHDEAFPFRPGQTSEGLVAFGRDQQCSQQVWSADQGYPGDERYRDFMRDVGLEAPMEYLEDFLGGSRHRQFTGLKYFRSSQNGSDPNLYNAALAAIAVEEHANHFVNSLGARLATKEAEGVANPVTLCAFDADLFGHWWFEGVDFLEQVFRRSAERDDFSFTTPSNYVASETQRGNPLLPAAPVSSSWGEGGYFETWTSPDNNWVYTEIYTRAEQLQRMVRMMEENQDDYPAKVAAHRKRCFSQMTRELLLAQASDWGFLMRNESSREYATIQTRLHLSHFDEVWKLAAQVSGEDRLEELEQKNPIFPNLPWDIFESFE